MWTKSLIISQYRYWHRIRYAQIFLCIIIIYLLNVVIGLQHYVWLPLDKLFQTKIDLSMPHIDIRKLVENEEYLGPPNNNLSNSFRISNEDLCGKNDMKTMISVHLLILVKSAIDNKQARQAIRMTWGDKHRLQQHHIKLAFVLGIDQLNVNVEQESKLYGDIVQIDKIDSYDHLTYKTVMMLGWVSKNCFSKSLQSSYNDIRNYVLFIDDDYYLDVDSLVNYLKLIDENKKMTIYERQTFITGYVHELAYPHRNLSSRWYISIIDYPYEYYPPFLAGGCILMTRYSAHLFYLASKHVRLLHLEDVYIGLLAYSMSIDLVKNNRRVDPFNSSINWYKSVFLSLRSFFLGDETRFCVAGYRGEQLLSFWDKLYRTN